jgi:hypothetical protein
MAINQLSPEIYFPVSFRCLLILDISRNNYRTRAVGGIAAGLGFDCIAVGNVREPITRKELAKRMHELAREFAETHDDKILAELFCRLLGKIRKLFVY